MDAFWFGTKPLGARNVFGLDIFTISLFFFFFDFQIWVFSVWYMVHEIQFRLRTEGKAGVDGVPTCMINQTTLYDIKRY